MIIPNTSTTPLCTRLSCISRRASFHRHDESGASSLGVLLSSLVVVVVAEASVVVVLGPSTCCNSSEEKVLLLANDECTPPLDDDALDRTDPAARPSSLPLLLLLAWDGGGDFNEPVAGRFLAGILELLLLLLPSLAVDSSLSFSDKRNMLAEDSAPSRPPSKDEALFVLFGPPPSC